MEFVAIELKFGFSCEIQMIRFDACKVQQNYVKVFRKSVIHVGVHPNGRVLFEMNLTNHKQDRIEINVLLNNAKFHKKSTKNLKIIVSKTHVFSKNFT